MVEAAGPNLVRVRRCEVQKIFRSRPTYLHLRAARVGGRRVGPGPGRGSNLPANAGAPLGRSTQPEMVTAAEGFECLNCQVGYYEDMRCSPPVQAARDGATR